MLYHARLNSWKNTPRTVTLDAPTPEAALERAAKKTVGEEAVLVITEKRVDGNVVYDCSLVFLGK